MRISPDDVGRRVAVRRVLDDGRTGLGDVIGELLGWSDGALTIRTRDRGEVVVPEGLMVAGRRVPPPPERRRTPG